MKTEFLGITDFNQNICKHIRNVKDEDTLYYLTWRNKPVAVLMDNDAFNMMAQAIEAAAKKKAK
jgi:PHD/YefM family antitoxin component YafN of YafNO toxin-antitoxin module